MLVYVLERTLRLLHPFMPFVTEEIWQHLPHEGEALIVAPWPQPATLDEPAETAMAPLMDIVRAIRNVRAEYNVEPGRRIAAVIVAGEQAAALRATSRHAGDPGAGERRGADHPGQLPEKPARALALVIGGVEVYLPLAGMVDLDAELKRLQAELGKTASEIKRVEGLLGNERFGPRLLPRSSTKSKPSCRTIASRKASCATVCKRYKNKNLPNVGVRHPREWPSLTGTTPSGCLTPFCVSESSTVKSTWPLARRACNRPPAPC